MSRAEYKKFIKSNITLFEKVFVKAKERTGKEYGKARSSLIEKAHKQFGMSDKDDMYVINKLYGNWQYYKGVS